LAEGTWLDVQEAAKSSFEKAKEDIDNPVYEVERAWKSGFNAGYKLAIKVLGVPQQDALNKTRDWVQEQAAGSGPSLGG
jgi:hypothetical protein